MENSILFFGGSSDERMVSVASAQNLIRNFDFGALWFFNPLGRISMVTRDELLAHEQAFKKPFVTIAPPFAESLQEDILSQLAGKVIFLGFHGAEGENGAIQNFLEKSKIAFTGSGSRSSHVCFNKVLAKEILSREGIKVPAQIVLSNEGDIDLEEPLKKFFTQYSKIVVKPVANGSSIGLHIIKDQRTFDLALADMKSSGSGQFLGEPFIVGRELTVTVLGKGQELRALSPSEVILDQGRSFDYEGKYLGLGTTEITPASLSNQELQMVQDVAIRAHHHLNCFGYSRTDLMLTAQQEIIYLETNTLPGLTTSSFVPQQLQHAGILLKDFIAQQLAAAVERNAK